MWHRELWPPFQRDAQLPRPPGHHGEFLHPTWPSQPLKFPRLHRGQGRNAFRLSASSQLKTKVSNLVYCGIETVCFKKEKGCWLEIVFRITCRVAFQIDSVRHFAGFVRTSVSRTCKRVQNAVPRFSASSTKATQPNNLTFQNSCWPLVTLV